MADQTPQFCTACGARLAAGAQFCASCGAAVAGPAPAAGSSAGAGAVPPPPPSTQPAGYPPPPSPTPDPNPTPASNNRIVLILAAGVVALLLIIGVIAVAVNRNSGASSDQPGGSPSASASVSKSPATNGMTQVTLNVAGCDDCTIKAVWAAFSPTAAPSDIWNSGPLPVVAGKVSFPVPVAKSQGLSFELSSPRDKKEAVTVAVVRYEQSPVGAPVTPALAAGSTLAYGCWAGSTFAEETLDLQVDWFPGTDFDGNPAQMMRAYFNPGLATYGTASETMNGDLAHQNVWSCTPGDL